MTPGTGALAPRDSAATAHDQTLERIASTGAWWSAADRLAIAEETRAAIDCVFCRERGAALSMAAVAGDHDHGGRLAEPVIEVIHGMRNDSGRLTRAWFEGVMASGLGREAYVELVSVVASTVVVDTYSQALGLGIRDLSMAGPGEPSFESSDAVTDDGAWVPIAALEDDAPRRFNILRSMGLVPSAVELFFGAFFAGYGPANAELALGRRQIELVASRVSAVNQCFY